MNRQRVPARALILALGILLLLSLFVSCRKKPEPETPIGLIAAYLGPDIDTTDHVFKKSDFQVLASYSDGRDEFVTDYEFEQLPMSQGYYIFRIAYNGCETEAYVQCHAAFFPSDRGEGGNE